MNPFVRARTCRPFHNPLFRFTLYFLCLSLVIGAPGAYPQIGMTPEELQEMQEAMRMMEEVMSELDPETRQMVEQMMTNPPAAGASTDDIEPVRDAARLAGVSARPMDDAALKDFIESLQPRIAAAMPGQVRERAELIDSELQKSGDYLPALRAAANGLAAWGALPEATWLMGKAALAGGDAQDLNNLAAFLTMLRAEIAALPILYTLNARYPENSTILNNLGQARYGLGEIEEAENLLLAAVRISPLHPQANATVARIQMARGDMQAAEASLHRSLQGGFTASKEADLRKTGGRLNKDDVRWLRPMPQDPLGLEKINVPAYPMKAAELPASTREWKAFKQMTSDTVNSLNQQAQQISAGMSEAKIMNAAMSSMYSPHMLKASSLMGSLTEQYEITYTRQMEAIARAMEANGLAYLELGRRIEAIDEAGEEQYRNVAGGYAYEYTCGEVAAEIDNYLGTHNRVFAELQTDMLNAQRRYQNELSFLAQYTSPGPELFELAKLAAKTGYTQFLNSLNVALFDGMEARAVCFEEPKAITGSGVLVQYDDFHCEYISTLEIPSVGTIVSRCNVTEANFSPIFAPFSASWTTEITDNNTNLLTRASAEVNIDGVTVGGHSEFDTDGMKSGGLNVGVSRSLLDSNNKLAAGPLEIGVKAGVTAGIEFDRGGITDVRIDAGLTSRASSSFGDTGVAKSEAAVKAGVNSTWSWNAGFGGGSTAGVDSSVF